VDAITDPDRGLSYIGTTDQALHEAAFQLAKEAGFLTQTGSEHATRRALALHVASPKVEAFYHYYRERSWPPPPEDFTENDCISWVDWYGQRVCDVNTLRQLATVETIEPGNETAEPVMSVGIISYFFRTLFSKPAFSSSQVSPPEILPFDHINPPPGKHLVPPSKTAVLYTDLKSGNFRDLHSYLYQESRDANPRLKYILRLRPSHFPNGSKMPLSGYATVLDLKKTEYLAQDDRRRSDQGKCFV
jgi:UDP-glucose:glycoprotein glucosyltransferase